VTLPIVLCEVIEAHLSSEFHLRRPKERQPPMRLS
jgi:hypothetical protein